MSESTSPAFSLEFFPRDLAGQERLVRAAKQMLAIQPKYVSVTFGAGGSTRAGTADAVRTLRNLGCDAAPHLSCVGASRQDLRDILQAYKNEGVRRVVALRGDLPSGMGGDAGELRYANELVSFIREETGDWFHIEVAAYPRCTRRPPVRRPTWRISWPGAGRRQRRHHAVFLQRRRLFRLCRPGPGQGRERADRAGHHAHHQPLAAAALGNVRRRSAALDPPAPGRVRRRQGLDPPSAWTW